MSKLTTIKDTILSMPEQALSGMSLYAIAASLGTSSKYVRKVILKANLNIRRLRPWQNTSHGRLLAIRRFNESVWPPARSVSEMYKRIPSSTRLAGITGFSGTTILRWLRQEGAAPKPKGGNNRADG